MALTPSSLATPSYRTATPSPPAKAQRTPLIVPGTTWCCLPLLSSTAFSTLTILTCMDWATMGSAELAGTTSTFTGTRFSQPIVTTSSFAVIFVTTPSSTTTFPSKAREMPSIGKPVQMFAGEGRPRRAYSGFPTITNQFDYANPAYGPTVLGVGDFDGDKADDLFLATGTAWYYSAGGKTEWRFLSPKTETIGQLLLGDFDGDGRTDVVTLQDGKFMVSWGGLSTWELLNPNPTAGRLTLLPSAVTAMAVGDFDGNKLADIFWADGQTWWVSYGGTTAFQEVQTSSFHRSDLRFGDFNGDGRTDVFGISNTDWEVSYAPSSGQGLFSSWRPLRARLTNTVAGLVVADFNGDGHADVATDCDGSKCWRISYRGFEDWITIAQPASLSRDLAGVGHFPRRRSG